MREIVYECERWRAVLPQGTIKGISQMAARDAVALRGGRVEYSWVRLWDDGVEELFPWKPA